MLATSPSRHIVAHVWRQREKTEREAASLFDQLARGLDATGAPRGLVKMAQDASAEETEHAASCRDIIRACQQPVHAHPAERIGYLGPLELSEPERVLYTSAAMCCITETLSTALLLEMRKNAEAEIIADTVEHILSDEVNHSRLGWAHLAIEAERSDVTWLSHHLPAMLNPVLSEESQDASKVSPDHCKTLGFGILPRATVQDIFRTTLHEVILPGFAQFGINIEAAQTWSQDSLSQRSR